MKANAAALAHMIAGMLDGAHNCKELADISGLHYVTVLNYTRAMHRVGACHIAQYEADSRGRHTIKVYKIGAGKDARPVRMAPAQRQARHREKLRARKQHTALSFIGTRLAA